MAKPARSRDYKAEEARRNAKAKALGFSSRAQQRRAQRHGLKLPRKGSSPRGPIKYAGAPIVTPAVLRRYSAKPLPVTIGGGVKLPTTTPIGKIRRDNQKWSDAHSRVPTSRYDPEFPADTARRYHAAFVDPDTRAWKIENGLDSLRDYLVDDRGFYDDVEFDERYGVDIAV